MLCEACRVRGVETEEQSDPGFKPYRLCSACHRRLVGFALRPSELFNLVAVHGHAYLLHDDFYDYSTGEATQPEIAVVDPQLFPFPTLEEVKKDLDRLVDFACVQYFTEDRVFELLAAFDKHDILACLTEKVTYNRAINYKAYEIAARTVGEVAEQWIMQQWTTRTYGELAFIAPALAKCLSSDKGFDLVAEALQEVDDRLLTEQSFCLLHFESPRSLNLIERMRDRIQSVSTKWGTIAAASQFSWAKAKTWLSGGRPLSLIALDALVHCTTVGPRLNQTFWFRKHPPKLVDHPNPQELIKVVHEYVSIDHVPRTKQAARAIEENVRLRSN